MDATYNSSSGEIKGSTILQMFHNRNVLMEQYSNYKETNCINKHLYGKQIKDLEERAEKNVILLETYHKEYVALKEKLKTLDKEEAVSFITDGKIFKGYNKYGKFVNVIDKYENYAIIEYEDYKINDTIYGERIKRVYDNSGKQVKFKYNRKTGKEIEKSKKYSKLLKIIDFFERITENETHSRCRRCRIHRQCMY